jgi:hypothetical protein
MSKMTLEEIAALPFHREGGVDFDCAYAVRIWDARNRIALNKLIDAEPDKPHDSLDGLLHYVPHGDGTGAIWRMIDPSPNDIKGSS